MSWYGGRISECLYAQPSPTEGCLLPRFGAVGKSGSIAVVERFHRTIKEILRLITIPEDQTHFEQELRFIVDWYNGFRPHDTLGGKTSNEVYFSRLPANEQPRLEPRKHWPRGSPCAKPQVGVEDEPGEVSGTPHVLDDAVPALPQRVCADV